ncbi:MAG: AIR synthase-related protein, partial [Candidatus Eremiobacteraeota bacterium]|nr:AIR synthase-related protein [Candidatus Eremiobacteraeota bacterium]
MQLPALALRLLLLGERGDELGGSVLGDVRAAGTAGALPPLDYDAVNAEINVVLRGVASGDIVAAHDISDGGLLACVAEMCIGGDGDGTVGAQLVTPRAWAPGVAMAGALLGERGGFVVAVAAPRAAAFLEMARAEGAACFELGMSGGTTLAVDGLLEVSLRELSAAWTGTLRELFA